MNNFLVLHETWKDGSIKPIIFNKNFIVKIDIVILKNNKYTTKVFYNYGSHSDSYYVNETLEEIIKLL